MKLMILFLSGFVCFAYESSDAFIINVESDYYKVVSPKRVDKKSSLIFKNRMLTKLRGKLVSKKRGDIRFISIKPRAINSIEFKYDKSDRYSFVPMSPPFQAIDLRLGQKSYEIPEKR